MNENALLLGFRDNIKLSIYLDFLDNETIYIQFGNEYKFTRQEFNSLLNFLRVTNQSAHILNPEKLKGKSGIVSPKSMAKEGFVWLLENGTLKIEWRSFIKTIPHESYKALVEELELSTQGLSKYDKVKLMTPETRKALGIDEAGRTVSSKDTKFFLRSIGYGIIIILIILDFVLIVSSIVNFKMLYLVGIITLVIILSYLILPESEKKGLTQFYKNSREYADNDFLKNANNLPVSRKTIELFLILFIVMTFMTVYFTKAIPTILEWGKKLQKGAGSTESEGQDVINSMSYSKKNQLTIFDVDKKVIFMADFYKELFKAFEQSKITLKSITSKVNVDNNFNYIVEGKFYAPGLSNNLDLENQFKASKLLGKLKITQALENNYNFKIENEFSIMSNVLFKKPKPAEPAKYNIYEIARKNIIYIVGEKCQFKIDESAARPADSRGRKVNDYNISFYVNNYDQLIKVISFFETEAPCLQFIIEGFTVEKADSYKVSAKIYFVYSVKQ
ncbi:MAG: hypothetical protein QMC67_02110 [Candidatus Wallbacteria bacterium]